MTFQSKTPALDFIARVRKAQPEGFKDISTPFMWHGNSYAIKIVGEFSEAQEMAIRAMRKVRP